MAKERTITASRLGRLSLLGHLAGGVVSEGAKQLAQGQRPSVSDLLLTTHNAQRLADRLSEMRGAATRNYPPQQRAAFHQLLHACVEGDDEDVRTGWLPC